MDGEFSLKTAAAGVLEHLSDALAGFVPRVLTALTVFILGLLLAKLAARGIRGLFSRLKIDELLERVGFTAVLKKFGLQETPGAVLARMVYYLLVLLFAQSAAQAVGLVAVSDAISSFFTYLPNLVAAFIVLLIGMMLSQFAGGAVTRSAQDSGVEFAPILGRSVSALILFVVAIMAVSQLRIDTRVIYMVVQLLLVGAALALALSFGLGTRDVTRNIVAGFYARKVFSVGEEIEMDGQTGVLVGVTALQTLLERDGRTISVPNHVFIEQSVRQ